MKTLGGCDSACGLIVETRIAPKMISGRVAGRLSRRKSRRRRLRAISGRFRHAGFFLLDRCHADLRPAE